MELENKEALKNKPRQAYWEVAKRVHDNLTDQLLLNRSISNPEKFFDTSYERDSHNPFLMPDMERSVDRILQAFEKNEKIAIFGDYDADGIPGTAVLYKVFQANNKKPIAYLPDREKEGYGLNNSAIEHLAKEDNVKLIITVDLGITGKKEVEYAKELGVDVIITDHHEPMEETYPDNAFAVVHPRAKNSKYPFGYLAGGGVAWKLAQAIALKTGKPNKSELKWLLELPAISTFCDVVPLQDENRMIAKFGLKVLSQTRNIGLRALYRAGGIDTNKIDEFTVGFQIGPRLNAPGRMDHASLAFNLLTTDSEEEAQSIAAKIEEQNFQRRSQAELIQKQAFDIINERELYNQNAMIVTGNDWQLGLVGLVAGRVAEKFHRPIFLLGKKIKNGEEFLQGSARSIDGFHLVDALESVSDLLEEFGGHEKAAGMTIKAKNFPEFEKRILDRANKILSSENLRKKIKVDAHISANDITKDLIAQIEKFAPFGEANPKPKFAVNDLTVQDVRVLGAEGKHLKIKFKNHNFEAIGFGMGGRASEIFAGSKVDILGSLELNIWTNRDGVTSETVQVLLNDFRASA